MTEIIIALDTPDRAQAEAIVNTLGNAVDFYKIGLEFALSGGLEFARDLIAENKRVFLDLKMFDIGNTVGKAIENAVRMGVHLTTVHAMPQTMEWAAKAAQGSHTSVVAVTVLTSWDQETLAASGVHNGVEQEVLRRARMACDSGLAGVVSSVHEAAGIRAATNSEFLIVTPGIRLASDDVNDQKRIATPKAAQSAGSTHLVIGRPVTQSADPQKTLAEIQNQLS